MESLMELVLAVVIISFVFFVMFMLNVLRYFKDKIRDLEKQANDIRESLVKAHKDISVVTRNFEAFQDASTELITTRRDFMTKINEVVAENKTSLAECRRDLMELKGYVNGRLSR